MNMSTKLNTLPNLDKSKLRQLLAKLRRESPLPEEHDLINLGMFQRSSLVAKLFYLDEIYQAAMPTQGVVMEFGVWWGQTLIQLENLRAMREPYNYTRKIIGFDTFTGYPQPSGIDGNSDLMSKGQYSVGIEYVEYLSQLLNYHEQENNKSSLGYGELRAGDAPIELEKYLTENPHTIVSLAIFDMQLYEPTYKCLKILENSLTKGSVIAFDEINNSDFPGITLALREAWGLSRYTIRKSAYLPDRSYIVID